MPPVTAQVPGKGGGTLSYTIPGDGLDVETVYVAIDATAAGGDVTAELTITDQSGVVIARKPQSSQVTAGAPGSATWGLRLDDGGGTYTPPRAFDTWRSDVRTIANGALQPLLWNPGNEFGPNVGLVEVAGAFDHLAVPVDCNLAVAMWVEVLTAMTAGGWFVVRYEMCDNMTGGPVTLRQSSPHASAANQFPGPVAVSMTAPMVTTGGVFAQLQVMVENNDGAAARDFRVNLATFANLG